MTLCVLASVVQDQGDLKTARTMLERVLSIEETILGPNHPDLASTLNGLAVVMKKQGELDAARTIFQRALSIHEAALGPNHPQVATTLSNLANVLRQQGEHVQAKDLMKRSIAINHTSLPEEHPDTTSSQAGLANIRAEMSCSKCGVRGVKLKHCSICKIQYYCSADCQVQFRNINYSAHPRFVHVACSRLTINMFRSFFFLRFFFSEAGLDVTQAGVSAGGRWCRGASIGRDIDLDAEFQWQVNITLTSTW
jgi:tetratricopeptide (TPR) repeat protein